MIQQLLKPMYHKTNANASIVSSTLVEQKKYSVRLYQERAYHPPCQLRDNFSLVDNYLEVTAMAKFSMQFKFTSVALNIIDHSQVASSINILIGGK